MLIVLPGSIDVTTVVVEECILRIPSDGLFEIRQGTGGLQIGLVNYVERLEGVQIGFLNFATSQWTLPFINVGW